MPQITRAATTTRVQRFDFFSCEHLYVVKVIYYIDLLLQLEIGYSIAQIVCHM